MGGAIKFGIIINQKKVLDRIFLSKKDKQRYLDYAYKIGLKRALKQLMAAGVIENNETIFSCIMTNIRRLQMAGMS